MIKIFRVGLAASVHTEKDGGKSKATTETLKDRGLEACMKSLRNYMLVFKELDKLCPRQRKDYFRKLYEFL